MEDLILIRAKVVDGVTFTVVYRYEYDNAAEVQDVIRYAEQHALEGGMMRNE